MAAAFTKADHAFDNIWLTASVAVPYDFNGDGLLTCLLRCQVRAMGNTGKIPGSLSAAE